MLKSLRANALVIVLLILLSLPKSTSGQAAYNACVNALELCPGESVSVNNYGANSTFCPDCEDDFSACFSPENSVWFTFNTNSSGGDVNVGFSSLTFSSATGSGTALQATIIRAAIPCNSASYSYIGNCVNNGTAPFVLSATSLLPDTEYYVVVSGSSSGPGVTDPAECSFDITLSGSGVDRALSSVMLSTGSNVYCANETVTFTATLTDCPDLSEFRWYVNGILAAVTSAPFFQTASLVDQDIVSVETTCYALCPLVVTDEFDPLQVVTVSVDAGSDFTIESGDTVQLTGTTNATTFIWSPSFAMSSADALSPFVWPSVTTTYTLTATEGLCSQSDQVTVIVEQELFLPNTFSPNEDGANDTWQIKGIELYPNSFVRIYDRWGQEVFQSTGYSVQKAWDGTVPSGDAAEGVYFYIVELRDTDKQVFRGSITLIR
ncbi:MAG: gliding motility-associated C-terminal domain-containing protein [Bacteroidota bacterium]